MGMETGPMSGMMNGLLGHLLARSATAAGSLAMSATT
jgi:hypothetical protein